MMYRTRDGSFFRDYRVEICDSVCGTVREFGAVLGEVYEIGLDELRGLSPETLRYETVRCFFRRRSGETVTAESILLPNDSPGGQRRFLQKQRRFTGIIRRSHYAAFTAEPGG